MSMGVMFQQIMAVDGKSMASKSSKTTQKTKTQKSFKDLFDKIEAFESKVKNNKTTHSKDEDIPEELYNFLLQLMNFIQELVDENFDSLELADLENEGIMLKFTFDDQTLDIDNIIGDSELWQRLISEVKTNNLTDETLSAFMNALQEKFPKIKKIDNDILMEQITKLLNNVQNGEEVNSQKNSLKLDKQFDTKDKIVDKTEEHANFKSEQEKAVDRESKIYSRKQKLQKKSKPELVQNTIVTDEEQFKAKNADNLEKNIIDTTTLTQKSNVLKEPIEINAKVLQQDESVNFDKVFNKIVQKVDTLIDDEIDMIRIRLKPDFLGDVLIKIVSEDGQLKTQLFIENAKVREAFHLNAANLKTQIQEQGYSSVEVDVYDMADSGYMDYQGNQNNSNQNFDRPKQRFYQNLRNEATKRNVRNQYDSWYDVSSVNYMA